MRIYSVFKGIVRILVLLLLCLLGVAVYLAEYGLPAFLQHRLLQILQDKGLTVDVDRVGLDLYQGLWIRGLVMYGSQRDAQPLFAAEEVIIKLRPDHRQPTAEWVRGVHLQGGRINIRLHDHEDEERNIPEFMVLEDILVDISARPGGWSLDHLSLRTGTLKVFSHGIYHPDPDREISDAAELIDQINTGVLLRMTRQAGIDTEPFFRQADKIEWPRQAIATVVFALHMDDVSKSHVLINTQVQGFGYMGIPISQMRLCGGWKDGRFLLEDLELAEAEYRLRAGGEWNAVDRELSAHGYWLLPPAYLYRLMPSTLEEKLRETGIFINGNVEGEITIGPAALTELTVDLAGWINADMVAVREMRVADIRVAARKEGDYVQVKSFAARIGDGWMRGDGALDLASRHVEVFAEAEIDPGSFVTLFSGGTERFLRSFAFRRPSLHFHGHCRGNLDQIENIDVRGSVKALDFIINGTHVDHFECSIYYAQNTIRFEPFTVSRREGSAEGWALVNLEKKTVEMDAFSSLAPMSVFRIISPELASALRTFHFEGPAELRATGVVHYQGLTGSRLAVKAKGQRMGIYNMIADDLEFSLFLRDARMMITDIHGRFYGGTIDAGAEVDFQRPTDTLYSINVIIRSAILADLIQDLRQVVDTSPYEGRLYFSGWADGRVMDGETRWDDGIFDASVRGGRLFQVPLLGGLSEYLSMIYDGFGYFSQTELVAEGLIRNDRVRIQDSELRGSVISARGRGSAYFDQRLDIIVEVQLLRRGFIARLLRLVTRPVTRLLEFRLTGTLDAPQWWPRNVPRRLF